MPELPEVERARRRLEAAVAGRSIVFVDVLHANVARRVSRRTLASLAGVEIVGVARRGKHQLIRLQDGRTVHAHFRMTGDWHIDRETEPLPRFARAVMVLDDGSRVVLDDPRALSTLDVHPAGSEPDLGLGPEPTDPTFTVAHLRNALAGRRGPIKPVLLDQRVVAGLGNIYAVEALWLARIAPTAIARALDDRDLVRLRSAIIRVIARASGARYRESASRFAVYDRDDQRCRRCGSSIKRILQSGRSTYYCPGCQLAGRRARVSRGPRSGRP